MAAHAASAQMGSFPDDDRRVDLDEEVALLGGQPVPDAFRVTCRCSSGLRGAPSDRPCGESPRRCPWRRMFFGPGSSPIDRDAERAHDEIADEPAIGQSNRRRDDVLVSERVGDAADRTVRRAAGAPLLRHHRQADRPDDRESTVGQRATGPRRGRRRASDRASAGRRSGRARGRWELQTPATRALGRRPGERRRRRCP